MSALDDSREALRAHWRVLLQEWSAACEMWRDEVRDRFEKEYWQDFSQVVPRTLEELEQLARMLDQARRGVH